MRSRSLLRVSILALFAGQSHLAPCLAQANSCAEVPSEVDDSPQGPSAIIDNVEFHGDNPFSETQWSAAISQVKTAPFGGPDSIQDHDVLEYIATPIRDLLQDHGYFKAVVTPRVYFIRAEADVLHYVLSVTVQAGEQYRLGNVRFQSIDPDHPGLAFSESDLRQQLALKQGDLFDTSKVRDSLNSLDKLYRSKGFIDMVPTPDTDTHEHDSPDAEEASDPNVESSIDLTIKIDEGKPYHISKIEVVGLPFDAVQQLQLPQVAGDVFNPNLWKDYLDKDGRPLPKDARKGKNMTFLMRDMVHHTISLSVDFRPCQSMQAVPITYSEVALPESSATPANSSAQTNLL